VVEALKALASGEWAGKNLSRPVGSKKQKKALQVPIMAATVNSTVSILWQIDIGFYDELPWIQQHVIKGKHFPPREEIICTNFYSLANRNLGSRGELWFTKSGQYAN
jgi:hypothetical protein